MEFSKGQFISKEQAMGLALLESSKGVGWVEPNPPVGAVLVNSEHQFLASGYHKAFGKDHAEVDAIKKLSKEELLGSHIYVTLEPCSHFGKTPPCVHAILDVGISEVSIAFKDPNPKASNGTEALIAAGVKVNFLEAYELKSMRLLESFLHSLNSNLPFVSLKLGTSLDGKIALKNGESQWVTNEAARKRARVLRAHHCATLIGAGTFLQDNPSLDFRGTEFENKKHNKIVVFDPKGKVNFENSRLLEVHENKNIFLLGTKASDLDAVNYLHTSELNTDSLKWLYGHGIHKIFVEGGRYVISSLLRQNLIQRIYLFQSGKVLGEGLSWSEFFKIDRLANAPTFHLDEQEWIDGNLMVSGLLEQATHSH